MSVDKKNVGQGSNFEATATNLNFFSNKIGSTSLGQKTFGRHTHTQRERVRERERERQTDRQRQR
jgi:hypothetical protein